MAYTSFFLKIFHRLSFFACLSTESYSINLYKDYFNNYITNHHHCLINYEFIYAFVHLIFLYIYDICIFNHNNWTSRNIHIYIHTQKKNKYQLLLYNIDAIAKGGSKPTSHLAVISVFAWQQSPQWPPSLIEKWKVLLSLLLHKKMYW